MEKKFQINYLEILKKSWRITWRNRYLWWFGFFAVLSGWCGNYLNYGFDFSFDRNNRGGNVYEKERIMDFLSQNIQWVVAVALTILILLIVFLVLGFLGRGALISSIGKESAGESSNFKMGFREGGKNFWKILAIFFICWLFVLATMLVLAIPVVTLFLNENNLTGVLMMGIATLIFIPVAVLVAYIRIYGYLYAVLGKLSFWSSLESAYNLFRKNLGSSIMMGLVFIPLNIFLAIISMAAFIPLAVVFVLIGLVAFLAAGKTGIIATIIVAMVAFLAVVIFLKSVYEVFAQSVWIFFFHEIAKTKGEELVENPEPAPSPISKAMPVIEAREGED